MSTDKEFKELVMTHLEYIKKRVDDNYNHLQKLNGRVGKTENAISWIKGIGISISFVVSTFIAYLLKE